MDNVEVVVMWSEKMGAGGGFYGVGDEVNAVVELVMTILAIA